METKRIRIEVNRGYGSSLGNLIEVLTDSTSVKSPVSWIEVEEREENVFVVVDDNMTVKDGNRLYTNVALGFISWDDRVEDLDNGSSDESQCFGMSSRLRWNDVEMTPEQFRAPSIFRLMEALTRVVMNAWCPGDI